MADKENPIPSIPVLLTAPGWKRPWLWDQIGLPYLLLRHRVHLFHNFVALGPLPEISFPVLCPCKSIVQVHDWHMFSETATDIERFYRQTARIRIQKEGLKRAKRIVVDSEWVKTEAYQMGIMPDQLTVIQLGCDHFDKVNPEPWPMENFVLSVGDTANKNLPFTLNVLLSLRAKFVHLNWVIVGNHNQVIKQLGTQDGKLVDWITILENPTDGLLKSCYQKALALLFPSTQEGFGIPVLEAMNLGCPVLVSTIEPLKTLLANAPGLLPLNDPDAWVSSLSRLLHDGERRRAASEAGKLRALDFTWNRAAQTLIELYTH